MPIEKKYQEIQELYELAERKLKSIEHLDHSGVYIPSINELRYAGRHVLDSLISQEPKIIDDNVFEAKDHCRRAIFDTMEIGICYYLHEIEMFENDYKYISISDVIPDFVALRQEIRGIQKFIANTSRRDQLADNYENAQRHFERLQIIMETFEASRPELQKKLNGWRWAILSTLIVILLAIITLILTT
jgi:hypothetical protein